MKRLFSILIFWGMICLMSIQCFALQGNFTFSVGTTEKVVKPGEEVEIDLKVSDITSEKNGINAVQGDLSHSGKDVVESIDIVGKTNWSIQINKEENSNLKGRFVLSNLNGITTDQTIGTLKIKIKEGAQAGDVGYIYLKNVHSSYANNNGVTEEDKTNSYDVTIKITIENNSENTPQEPENPPVDTTPEPDTSEPEKPSTDKKPEKDNTIADKPLSQTGAIDVVIPILVLSLITVILIIKYKKLI